MSIRQEITVDADILLEIERTGRAAPRAMRREFDRAQSKIATPILQKLKKKPGPPQYPLEWESERQRRFVMAKLRRENNLPYRRRPNGIVSKWRVVFKPRGDVAGILIVENPDPAAQYLQGDKAQRFHIRTGWVQAAPLVAEAREKSEALLIETWYKVAEPRS